MGLELVVEVQVSVGCRVEGVSYCLQGVLAVCARGVPGCT